MTLPLNDDGVVEELRNGLRLRTVSHATYALIESLAARYRLDSSSFVVSDRRLVRGLVNLAHRLVVPDPIKAETVAFVALNTAANLPSRTFAESGTDCLLEGKAWYEYASALLRVGRHPEAREAVLRAKHFFRLPFAVVHVTSEDACADLLYGQVLYWLDKREAGLHLIDQAAVYLLLVCEDRQLYVKAKTIYATLLMRLERFEEALDVLDEMVEMAEEHGDDQTLAMVTHNIGLCAARLGDDKRAEACQEVALKLCLEQGMKADLPRIRGALVSILRTHGRFAEAISHLYMVRDEYLGLCMPLIAARYSMDAAELLIKSKRNSEARHLCTNLLRTFRRANLTPEARKALKFLKTCAASDSLTEGTVVHVRDFLVGLSANPSAMFAP